MWENPMVAKAAVPHHPPPRNQSFEMGHTSVPPVGTDPATGKPYWLDPITGQSTWTQPSSQRSLPTPPQIAAPEPMGLHGHPTVGQAYHGDVTVMIVPQPGMDNQAQPLPAQALGHFSSGFITGCCDDPGTLLYAWCCPCFSYSDLVAKAEPRFSPRLHNPLTFPSPKYSALTSACHRLGNVGDKVCSWWLMALAGMCCGCGPCCCYTEAMTRRDFRSTYQIHRSTMCWDYLVHWCCAPCALSQLHRHIDRFPLNPRPQS